MPQPTISGVPPILKFGGAALPQGQGTMAQLNLNDTVNWQWQEFRADDDYVQLTVGQLAWRAASVILGRDRKARILTLPMRYLEASTSPASALGVQIALMEQAGLQQITFDNATYIAAEFSGLKSRAMLKKFSPYYWAFDLEFLCPEPYFLDLATTTVSPQALASGSATTFNVTYAGSVWAPPVWTLTIPNTNPAPIQSFSLSNTMPTPNETLAVAFPGSLAALTAWTITIDASALTVTDQTGRSYDMGGSFPKCYGPAGQVNPFSATLTPASGTATGCTIGASYQSRWLI